MKSVFVLCVLPLLCWAASPKLQPKVKLPQPSPHEPQDVKIGGHDVTVCTHDHARNLAVMLIFTDKTKATQAFCPNEHVVTVISSKHHEKDAKKILTAVVEESHKYGGGAHRLTLVGEGTAAHIVWNLLQDPSTHDLYHNVLFYDVIPGLYNVNADLDSFPRKKNVVFGLTPQEPIVPEDKEEVIEHAADFLGQDDDRLLKTLKHFYGKRALGTVIQDVTLFHGLWGGLERMMETEGHVYIYEGGKHEEKLTEALVIFALTDTPGFLTTETAWPSFESSKRMYLELSGAEATFQEGWRHKNSMLWDMINPTLPQKPQHNN